jgi:hypothetical protein
MAVSTAYVNRILPKDAAAVHIPGHVIQVVTKTERGIAGTSSGSMVATGKYIDITPKYSNSIIIVKFIATQFVDGASATRQTIRRNGVDFITSDGTSNTSVQTEISQMGFYGSGNSGWYGMGILGVHDKTHNSTSPLRYEVYFRTNGGTGNIYFPPGGVDQMFMEAMEIAQ